MQEPLGQKGFPQKERQSRAISAFENALKIDPGAPSVDYNLGLIYEDQ